VRGDTDIGPGQIADGTFCRSHQFCELVDRADEPALAGMRRGAAERAMRIETRQHREADATELGGPRNPRRHLGRIGVGRAVVVVMQIMEFADARKTLLQHFDIEQRCDGFGVVRSHFQGETVHRLAPCPERVSRVAANFGEARHAALEGVTVQACYSGDGEGYLCDGSIGHDHLHIVSPPGREQRRSKMQSGHVFQTGWTEPRTGNMYRHIDTPVKFPTLEGNAAWPSASIRSGITPGLPRSARICPSSARSNAV
jgi:hypothetical protein